MFNRFCFGAFLLAGLVLPLTSCSNSPSLTSIVISPTTVTVTLAPDGFQQGTNQYTAIGYYTHPNHAAQTKDITNEVTWSSSSTQVATVNSSGLATATGYNQLTGEAWTGNTTITASASGFHGDVVSNQATFNVTACTSCSGDITKLTVIPATQTVATLNTPVQFEAIGTTSAGDTVALSTASWISSNTAVASINASSGLATTTGAGTSTITATYTNYDGSAAAGSATLTVTSNTSTATESISALAVSPNAQTSTAIGQTANFIALATTTSGTTVNLTNQTATVGTNIIKAATWTSSNSSVATIDAATGVAKSVGTGASVITAMAYNPDGSVVSGAATFTVSTGSSGASTTEPLASLAIVPSSQTLTVANQAANLIAIGTTSSSTTVNLTNQSATVSGSTIKAAAWLSSVPSVASIDAATGVVTAKSTGTTAITATASNPDGTVVTAIATVTVTISGSSSGEPLTSLAIVPSSQTLTTTLETANLIVIGTTSTGTTVNLTNAPVTIGTSTIKAATWESTVGSVATIDSATGIVTAKSNGTTAITAIASNPDGTIVTGTATVTVNISATPEPLQSLTIIPGSISVAYPGQQGQFTVVGTTSAGTTVNLTNQSATVGTATIPAVAWSSSNKGVATVDAATGLVTAQGQGTAVIMAIGTNPDDKSVVTATAAFAVQNAASEPVTAITITPGTQSIAANQTAQFIALGTDGTTGLLSDVTTAVTWSSSNTAVATVGAHTGLVTPVAAGSTNIIAEYTNPATSTTAASVVTQTAALTVTAVTAAPEPLLSLSIIPTSQTLGSIRETAQYLAIGTTSTGASEDLTNSVAWVSSEINVATIQTTGTSGTTTGGVGEPAGLATIVGAGTSAITAVATNPDGTVVTGVATLTCPIGSSTTTSGNTTTTVSACSTVLPSERQATLTVIGMGTANGTVANPGNWLVTAPSGTGAENAIHCGPGSNASPSTLGLPVCSGTYPISTTDLVLTTTVPAGGTYTFGGWSSACTTISPSPSTPTGTNTCTISTLSDDETVAAIFNVVK
jgi:hypothetical protein